MFAIHDCEGDLEITSPWLSVGCGIAVLVLTRCHQATKLQCRVFHAALSIPFAHGVHVCPPRPSGALGLAHNLTLNFFSSS